MSVTEHSHRSTAHGFRTLRALSLLMLLSFTTGCMQLHVHVKLNPDGSALITERLGFSRRLLDRQGSGAKGESLVKCLSKPNAEARAKQMGESVRLVEHRISEREDGSRESVAVYSAPDLTQIRIPAPFLGLKEYPKGYIECTVEPCYRRRHAQSDRPGMMAVHFHQRGFLARPGYPRGAPKQEAPSPKELQRIREFLPAFGDMLQGFHVKLSVEAYNNFFAGVYAKPVKRRGTGIPTGTHTFLDLSDKQIDQWGRPIFESEEAVVEVMTGHFGGPHIRAQLGKMFHSNRVPLAFPVGFTYPYWRRTFKPSAYHYKKFFDGRVVSQGGNVKD